MFRYNKRNFSLRELPGKLSSLSPRCSSIQSSSPAKRLRLSDHVPLLSSTFIQDIKPNEETHLEKTKIDKIRIGTDIDRSISHQEASRNEVSVETPPPTPEIKTLTRLELLIKRKSRLIEDGRGLDKEIAAKFLEIEKHSSEIDEIKASRFKYDDFVYIVTLAQKEIRDHMNDIFAPGNEFGQKFESIMKEIHAKHERKFDKKSLELNSYIDQSKCAIVRKIEDLTHEIDLHQRTLLHREHLTTKSHSSSEVDTVKKDTSEPVQQDADKSDKIIQENGDKGDNDDCIIIESADDVNEEVINDESIETIAAKTEQLEEEDTDIDDNISTDEPVRSFTPCQAQRPV